MPDKVEVTSKKGSFFSNMVAELKKVIWPTAGQTAKGTGTVFVFVLIVTCILVALNFAFQKVNEKYWEQFNPEKATTSQVSEASESAEESSEESSSSEPEVVEEPEVSEEPGVSEEPEVSEEPSEAVETAE